MPSALSEFPIGDIAHIGFGDFARSLGRPDWDIFDPIQAVAASPRVRPWSTARTVVLDRPN